MRRIRRALGDAADRSARLWSFVQAMPAVRDAGVVMAFTSVHGEPHSEAFIAWCRDQGKRVVLPEQHPDAEEIDVVIVPGLAFTRAGHRLGQGGGWYDRFLTRIRPDCATIGVAFEPQLVDALPIEPHDVQLDCVVTDAGPGSA